MSLILCEDNRNVVMAEMKDKRSKMILSELI